MSLVVCGMYPSGGAAYRAYKKVVGVSKVALYDCPYLNNLCSVGAAPPCQPQTLAIAGILSA